MLFMLMSYTPRTYAWGLLFWLGKGSKGKHQGSRGSVEEAEPSLGRGAAYKSLKWPQFSPAPVAHVRLQHVEIRLLPRLKPPTLALPARSCVFTVELPLCQAQKFTHHPITFEEVTRKCDLKFLGGAFHLPNGSAPLKYPHIRESSFQHHTTAQPCNPLPIPPWGRRGARLRECLMNLVPQVSQFW